MLHPPVEPSAEQAPTTVLVSGERSHADRDASFAGRFLGRRRNYLVDGSYQVKTAIIAVMGMIFLLAFAAVLFHLVGLESALSNTSRSGDARSVLYLVAAGILFVAAVFIIEILETHKTAGVVLKVTRGMKDLETGSLGARVTLRKNDNFRELEEGFNTLARSLRDRIEDDLGALQNLEGQMRLVTREIESGNKEGSLLLLRQMLGDLQGARERKRNLMRAPDRGGSATRN